MTAARAAFDRRMMAVALRMAKRGLGTTAFNPSVGAVIADEATGTEIARGWTQPGGRPHGEKEALRKAGERARGKTMYVTLEPCAHTGRVPTCADAVISAGLKRIVCCLADPNPVIAGGGFEQLRAAGVEVDVGLMAAEAHAVTLGHILHVTQGRPFVQLKLAVSADGRIADGNGAPVWVTGPQARARVHRMRADVDTILTGIGTVLADNPEMTCRLPLFAGRSPKRVIVDSRVRLPDAAKILRRGTDDAATVWLATTDAGAVSAAARTLVTRGRVTEVIAAGQGEVDLVQLLHRLDAKAVRRVMIEAGPKVSLTALTRDVVDEVVLFRGATALGAAGREPFGPDGLKRFATPQWMKVEDRAVGADRMITYRRNRTGA